MSVTYPETLFDVDALPENLVVSEIAELSRHSEPGIRLAIRRGELRAWRAGRLYLVRRDDFLGWIQPVLSEPDTETVPS